MAKIVAYRDIPLDHLVIGKGQVRTSDPGRDIDELAKSIEAQGLLQPIVVCPARQPNKWEILTGQRRFLAHKMLKRDIIAAAVIDERVEEAEAKAISITENLIRRKLSGKELIDGVTYLYNKYANARTVADTTGLPYSKILEYVKYPRLKSELKEMVDGGEIDVNVALKAQDACRNENDEVNVEEAIQLAHEMKPMTNVQRKSIVKERKANKDSPIDDVIEQAKSGARISQIVVTVTEDTHQAIRRFAKEEKVTQDGAASTLIEEALSSRGLLEE